MRDDGYTLLEMLVVVGLIGLLAGLAGKWIVASQREGERRIALVKCKEVHDACHAYRLFVGRFPEALEEMQRPLRPGEGRFFRLEPDPWGHPFRLEREGAEVRIHSRGPDGREGTADDLCYEPPE